MKESKESKEFDAYKTAERKKKFLDGMLKSMGNITLSCKNADNLNYSTYRRWLESDPEFKESVENDIPRHRNDFVLGKYYEQINDGSWNAIRFYLETEMKKTVKTEIELSGNTTNHNITSEMTAEEASKIYSEALKDE